MEYQEIAGRMPEKVFQYFKAISRIPRGSGNTKAVSDYCMAFAKERGLVCRQDEACNVVIIKEASPGYGEAPTVMLQGHLDMVCAKDPSVSHDFEKDPLKLVLDGDYIRAEGTTLGADNGIAVAYALAVLDSDDLPHPRLECVFTSDEETGMVGANALDMSGFQASFLLNLDSDNEGVFQVGCAGGIRCNLAVPMSWERRRGVPVRIWLHGLSGGHSGVDIGLGRGNAVLLTARILDELLRAAGDQVSVCGMRGGTQDNVIPSDCVLDIMADAGGLETVREAAASMEAVFRKEYPVTDPGLKLEVSCGEEAQEGTALTARSAAALRAFLLNAPNGVQAMNQQLPGQVKTSLNLGIFKLEQNGSVSASFLIRSDLHTEKQALCRRLETYADYFGGAYGTAGDYPEWEYVPQSPLRELLCQVYREQYGSEAKMETIHGGVECGLFAAGIPGLDAVSMGPQMEGIHTSRERLSISSVNRFWNFLTEVLRRMNQMECKR